MCRTISNVVGFGRSERLRVRFDGFITSKFHNWGQEGLCKTKREKQNWKGFAPEVSRVDNRVKQRPRGLSQ